MLARDRPAGLPAARPRHVLTRDFRIDIVRMVGAGDTVLVEARYRATAKTTHKPLDAQVAHVWEFRGGKAVKFQQYTDTWQFAQVTGVTPKS